MADKNAMYQSQPEPNDPNPNDKKAAQAMALARVDGVRMQENGMLMMTNHTQDGSSYDVLETDAKTWESLLSRHDLLDDSLKFPAISKNNPNDVYLKDSNLGQHSNLSGMEIGVTYGPDGNPKIADSAHFSYINKDGSIQETLPEFKNAPQSNKSWVYFDGVQRDGDQTYLLSKGTQIPIDEKSLRDFERNSGVGKNNLYNNNLLSDFENHPDSKAPFLFKESKVGQVTGLTAIAIEAPVDLANQTVDFSKMNQKTIDYQLDNHDTTEYMRHQVGEPTHLYDSYKNLEDAFVRPNMPGDNPKTQNVQSIPIATTNQLLRDGLAMDNQLSNSPGSNMPLPARTENDAKAQDLAYDKLHRPLQGNLLIKGLQVGQNDKLYAFTADEAAPGYNSSFEISKQDWNRIAKTTQLDNIGLDADSLIEAAHQQPQNKTRIDFADLKEARPDAYDFNAINVQSNFKVQDDGLVLFDFDKLDHQKVLPVLTLDKFSSDGYDFDLVTNVSKEMDRIKIDSQQTPEYPFSSNINENDMFLDSRVAFNSGDEQKFVYRIPKDKPFSVNDAYDDVLNGYRYNLKEAFNPQLQLHSDIEPIPVVEPNQQLRDQLLSKVKQNSNGRQPAHNSYSGEMSIAGLQMDDNRNLYALTEGEYEYSPHSKSYRGTFEISYEDWDRIAKTTHLDERGLSSKDLLENFTTADNSRVEFSSMGYDAIKSVRIQADHSINRDGQVKFNFDNVKPDAGVPNIYLKGSMDYGHDTRISVDDFHVMDGRDVFNDTESKRDIDKVKYVPRMQRLYPNDLMLVDINPVDDVTNQDFINHLKQSMQPNDVVQKRMDLTNHDKIDKGVANLRLESLTTIAGVGYVGTFKPTSAEEKAPQGQSKPVDSTILDYDDVHKILRLNGYSDSDSTAMLDTISDANERFSNDPLSDDVSHLKDVVKKPLYVKMDYKDDQLKPDTLRDVLAPDKPMADGAYQQGEYTDLDTINENVDKEVDKPLYNRVQGLLAQRRVLRMYSLDNQPVNTKPAKKASKPKDNQTFDINVIESNSKHNDKADDGPDL